VGQNHAAQEMYYRDHQRHAQEHGTTGTLKAQVGQHFLMSMISSLAAYCFFDNKTQALQGYYIENTNQLMLF